jgi:molybdopterin-biosynthesis enzyme MoeA-like protein
MSNKNDKIVLTDIENATFMHLQEELAEAGLDLNSLEDNVTDKVYEVLARLARIVHEYDDVLYEGVDLSDHVTPDWAKKTSKKK